MADPTLQMFCCRHTNRTDTAIIMMQEFNTDAYNAICMISSTIGILGAIYQILPRQDSYLFHHWNSFSASRGRAIIIWLAVADLFATLGIFIRSVIWITFKTITPAEDDTTSVVFCSLSSAWTQYFYMVTWIWTLCYAVDMKLLLGKKSGCPKYYHTIAWVLPAILTTFGLIILYIPDANCHNLSSLSTAILRILPNYCATYVLLTVIMVVNPILYVASTRDFENAVSFSMAQMTGRERKLIQTIKLKFALTNVVYYICWIPNLINGILLWTLWFQLPIKTIITLWYIMAITNPLQAFFNAIVYQRWTRKETFRFVWSQDFGNRNIISASARKGTYSTESSSLLSTKSKTPTSYASINGSSSL